MSPSDTAIKYIKEICKGINRVENRLSEDVSAVVYILAKSYGSGTGSRNLSGTNIKNHLSVIYWSLKLHLAFYLGKDHENFDSLKDLEPLLDLTHKELSNFPEPKHAVDPGSTILEILNETVDAPRQRRGSKDHADKVLKIAKDLFSKLHPKSIFRPKVLAKISHNSQWFVGSSIAVGQYLRPLYLYNRIIGFQPSLKKAVMFFEPLIAPDQLSWSTEAFAMKDRYSLAKEPCSNCKIVFINLIDFIPRPAEEDGQASKTFLAACAEYCPVNQLLPNDNYEDNSIAERLNTFKNQCSQLFEDFRSIADDCYEIYEDIENNNSAVKSKVVQLYMKIRPQVHIFGIKPECNASFKKPSNPRKLFH